MKKRPVSSIGQSGKISTNNELQVRNKNIWRKKFIGSVRTRWKVAECMLIKIRRSVLTSLVVFASSHCIREWNH